MIWWFILILLIAAVLLAFSWLSSRLIKKELEPLTKPSDHRHPLTITVSLSDWEFNRAALSVAYQDIDQLGVQVSDLIEKLVTSEEEQKKSRNIADRKVNDLQLRDEALKQFQDKAEQLDKKLRALDDLLHTEREEADREIDRLGELLDKAYAGQKRDPQADALQLKTEIELRYKTDRLLRADSLIDEYQEAAIPYVRAADKFVELTENPPIVNAYFNAKEYIDEEARTSDLAGLAPAKDEHRYLYGGIDRAPDWEDDHPDELQLPPKILDPPDDGDRTLSDEEVRRAVAQVKEQNERIWTSSANTRSDYFEVYSDGMMEDAPEDVSRDVDTEGAQDVEDQDDDPAEEWHRLVEFGDE